MRNELVTKLTEMREYSLGQLENVIDDNIGGFYLVGRALQIIRDGKKYLESGEYYGTFEEYVKDRWGYANSYGYQLMETPQIVDNLSAIADELSTPYPQVEGQARELITILQSFTLQANRRK